MRLACTVPKQETEPIIILLNTNLWKTHIYITEKSFNKTEINFRVVKSPLTTAQFNIKSFKLIDSVKF
jgi:hypothetical protein